ncbi:MAG: hypothetical protein ACLRYY_14155 [Anaerobutyricum soehngenii]
MKRQYISVSFKKSESYRPLSYLKNRGLSDETINHFGLGYADIYRDDDLYRNIKVKGFTDYQMKGSTLL